MSREHKVDCGACRHCCQGGELIFLHPEHGDDPARYMTTLAPNPLRDNEPMIALVHKPNGDCIYLGDAGCTIYADRPKICRSFSCIGFARMIDEQMRSLRGAEKRRVKKKLAGSSYDIGKEKMRERGE